MGMCLHVQLKHAAVKRTSNMGISNDLDADPAPVVEQNVMSTHGMILLLAVFDPAPCQVDLISVFFAAI